MEKELERKLTGLPDKVTKLEGDDAILLWLKGKDAWNKWMEEHPGSSITFTDIDFSPEFIKARLASYNQLPELLEWSKSKQLISFEEYQFHGNVYFDNVKFYSDVSFEGAIFRDELIFFDSKFYSDVDFSRAVFCGSHTLFHNVEFLKDAKFVFSRFESLTDFLNVKFSTASFFSATFEGNSAFQEIEIKGKAVFTDAFFERKVDFRLRSFLGELLFNNATFEGACSISSSCDNKALLTSTRRLTFQGADFRRWLKIDGYFTCIPDMRATKTGHHVDLSGLRVMLRRGFVQEGWGVEKAIDPADSERLCRLKELAESNKDHKRALEFHAAESTARRWGDLSPLQSMLDIVYSLTSNYGQSIARPFSYLLLSIVLFAIFSIKQPECIHKDEGAFITALTVSIATVTPFISISKTEREAGIKKLYGDKTPEDYGLYSYAHAGGSFIFIFLTGLGLRNRFRI